MREQCFDNCKHHTNDEIITNSDDYYILLCKVGSECYPDEDNEKCPKFEKDDTPKPSTYTRMKNLISPSQ